MSWNLSIVVAIGVAGMSVLPSASAAGWSITDLGALPGGTWSTAWGINNSGQVVGESNFHAFIWEPGAGMTDLGAGIWSSANAINDKGLVVGNRSDGIGPRAFYWSSSTGIMDLPVGTASYGRGVNSNGTIVGDGDTKAFIYDSIGGVSSIAPFPGGVGTSAYAVNASGQVVGGSGTTPGAPQYVHAFLRQPDGAMVDLGTLSGGPYASIAYDINNAGQVVGRSDVAPGYTRPFIWEAGKGMMDLGSPAGTNSAIAVAINNVGDVVGQVSGPWGPYPVLWHDGKVINLSDLPEVSDAGFSYLVSANDINDSGQIVGVGAVGGVGHAFLLSPIPEPDSLALFLVGIGLLGRFAGRRRNLQVHSS